MKKECTKCGKSKSLSEYYKFSRGRCGVMCYCKLCHKTDVNRRGRTRHGLITNIYSDQRNTSRERGDRLPNYTRRDLAEWIFNHDMFDELYNNWVTSGYNRKSRPSCDRLNDYKSYSLDNLRLVTWRENEQKGYDDRRNGINNKISEAIVGIHKDTGERVEYYSINEAHRKTGVNLGNICSCCQGNKKYYHAGGYIWSYKHKVDSYA